LQRVLQSSYRLEIFDGAAPALENLRELKADLVILDIRMEGIDGVEAYAAIRSVAPHLPIIFYTAYPLEDIGASEPHNLQYVTFLSKGCPVQELRKAIRDALRET
jgi:two-component system NtrC family response regulator/two-component system nitrogen regulation response regulator GlnG